MPVVALSWLWRPAFCLATRSLGVGHGTVSVKVHFSLGYFGHLGQYRCLCFGQGRYAREKRTLEFFEEYQSLPGIVRVVVRNVLEARGGLDVAIGTFRAGTDRRFQLL